MEEKEQRPDGAVTHDRGGNNLEAHKDKQSLPEIQLSKRQHNVYELLITGWYSAAEISIALGYSDPRSYIRELREKGANILDKWIENEETRYKRYTIK